MTDVATVRAEIKAWERAFKSEHRRDPTVSDVKQWPAIVQKYKLYKKLSKITPVAPVTASSSTTPTTPPRARPAKHDAASLLSSIPRPVESPAPLSSFNPFSPSKRDHGKRKETCTQRMQATSNPLSLYGLEENVIQPGRIASTQSACSSVAVPPLPRSAVSRARKRLRGEPVSPSPNKDKRRRIGLQSTLPFPKPTLTDEGDCSGCDDDTGETGDDQFFVDDSPAKPAPGGKSFKLLFDETIHHKPMNELFGTKASLKKTKSRNNVFADLRLSPQSLFVDLLAADSDQRMLPGEAVATEQTQSSRGRAVSRVSSHHRLVSSDDKLGVKKGCSVQQKKHSISDTEPEVEALSKPSPLPRFIPPSPPPIEASAQRSYNPSKGNGKAMSSSSSGRKKPKYTNEDLKGEDSEETDTFVSAVRIVHYSRPKLGPEKDANDNLALDEDPIMFYARFTTPHGVGTSLDGTAQQMGGNFEVELPEKLRRMLALNPKDSVLHAIREERVVKGLISGHRIGSYDPHRGGEIWDVGENGVEGDIGRDADDEDDWEGEPVPWEVGEL